MASFESFEAQLKKQQQIMATQQAQMLYHLGSPWLQGGISGGLAGLAPFGHCFDSGLIERLRQAEPRKVTLKVPDGIVPITAWRGWNMQMVGVQPRLGGLGKSVEWEPKKKVEAYCSNGASHPAPQASCTCGIWAFKSLDILLNAVEGYSPKVIGMVSLWGRIIETENGFRAQHAYPKELWLLDSSLEELGRVYDVPVRTAG